MTVLALVVGIGGFIVVVYLTTDLAAMYFGVGPLPVSLRPLAAHVTPQNRAVRTVVLVVFLVALEATVAVVLAARRDELDALQQALFAGELLAAAAWTIWLGRRYREASRRTDP